MADIKITPAKGRIVEIPTYEELKNNWQNLLFHGDNKDEQHFLN